MRWEQWQQEEWERTCEGHLKGPEAPWKAGCGVEGCAPGFEPGRWPEE